MQGRRSSEWLEHASQDGQRDENEERAWRKPVEEGGWQGTKGLVSRVEGLVHYSVAQGKPATKEPGTLKGMLIRISERQFRRQVDAG